MSFLSCVFFITTSLPVNAANTSPDILKSKVYLNAMSDEFNKMLPKRIDKYIELITTMGRYATFTLIYRTVNLTASEAKDINLIEGIKIPSTAFACNDPVFNDLLQAGVLITVKYVAIDYKNIGIINITKENCPS